MTGLIPTKRTFEKSVTGLPSPSLPALPTTPELEAQSVPIAK